MNGKAVVTAKQKVAGLGEEKKIYLRRKGGIAAKLGNSNSVFCISQ